MPLVLEPSWLGRRVTVRRVVGDARDGRPPFGDVVGDLVGLDAHDGGVTTPPRPGRGAAAARRGTRSWRRPSTGRRSLQLEEVAARGWRAPQTRLGRRLAAARRRRVHRPGELGAAAARARHAAGRGARRRPRLVRRARAAAAAAGADRGPPACSTPSSPSGLAGRPGRARADPPARPCADRPRRPARGASSPDDRGGWPAQLPGRRRPTAPAARAAAHAPPDRRLRRGRSGDGEPVAIGRGTVDERWLGVTAVEVAPAPSAGPGQCA